MCLPSAAAAAVRNTEGQVSCVSRSNCKHSAVHESSEVAGRTRADRDEVWAESSCKREQSRWDKMLWIIQRLWSCCHCCCCWGQREPAEEHSHDLNLSETFISLSKPADSSCYINIKSQHRGSFRGSFQEKAFLSKRKHFSTNWVKYQFTTSNWVRRCMQQASISSKWLLIWIYVKP